MSSSDGAEVACWSCGSPLSKRFCRTCGSDSGCPSCGEIALGRFCRSCGFEVTSKRAISPTSSVSSGPDASEVEELPVAVDEQSKHLDSNELEDETFGRTGATVVATAFPDGPLEPPVTEGSLDDTAVDDPSEMLDKPSPTRSRKKVFIAAAALLVVVLIASAVAFRSQGGDPQEELVVATTVPTTQPPTTLMTTTTTVAIPINVCGDPATTAPSYFYSPTPGDYASVQSVTELSTDPYSWGVIVSRFVGGSFWRNESITMNCAGAPGKFTVVWGRAG